MTGGASVLICIRRSGAGARAYNYFYGLAKQKGMSDEIRADNYAGSLRIISPGAAQAFISRVNPLAKAGGFPGGVAGKMIGNAGFNLALGTASSQIDPLVAKAFGLNDKPWFGKGGLAEELTERNAQQIFPSIMGGIAAGTYDALAHRGGTMTDHRGGDSPAPEVEKQTAQGPTPPSNPSEIPPPPWKQQAAPTPPPTPEPQPSPRLPNPPPELRSLSNNQIRQWAADNGYDVSRIGKDNGMGKFALVNEIGRQFMQSTAAPAPKPLGLPPNIESMDAGQIRGWMRQNGVEEPEAYTMQGRNQPDMPERKRLLDFLQKNLGGEGELAPPAGPAAFQLPPQQAGSPAAAVAS